ncbi:putative CECR1 family adenosine deaminase [Aspergillus aculeatinus CBS 121060]|uniref:Metallo-dependent hydrolase n=1 Tax=Aspergillus aculeatinus CBS 121060 TaxID=1448322 RepID=A0ACD1HMH8_9EURO|nr:Metallo-dependent hydrolase [Aspergillus aculeatinus CBS 121060]RAH74819.1 Metallo-dependent hydrolase [Aspergillus aculeatinus CBS 121060]
MAADDKEWELEEGIPQVEDPFIQQYLKGRDSLILQEQKQRHDFNLRKALTPVAARACKIVSQIRDRELTRASTPSCGPPALDWGQVRKTDLWKVVQRMPKGSLLNASIHGLINVDKLIGIALTTAGLHISSPQPLSSQEARLKTPVTFQYASSSTRSVKHIVSIWSAAYVASELIPVQQAVSSFPDGGETGFREWLKGRCTLGDEQSSDACRGAPIIDSLLSYEPILRSCLRDVFAHLAADGVDYAEFRHTFAQAYRREGTAAPDADQSEWCHVFHQELRRFQSTDEGRDFYGARIIWTTSRSLSNREIVENMQTCLFAKYDYPEVICGFDISGTGSDARPLSDLVPLLFWFRKECMDAGLEIPFFFHAGESARDGARADQDLYDAILLGTRRICDGSTLYKHPLLTESVKEKKILVEFNPTSSRSEHVLPALLSRGVSVALCGSHLTGGFDGRGAEGFTQVIWRVLLGDDDHADLAGLAMLVENSIRWSCYDDQPTGEWLSEIGEGILGEKVKARRLQEWWARFEQFCEWVTVTFAEEGSDG